MKHSSVFLCNLSVLSILMNVYRSENAMLLANSVPYWFLKIHIPVCKSSYTCVKSLFKEAVMQACNCDHPSS